jgi:hypothetical protein
MLSIGAVKKPSNAGWEAKAIVSPEGQVKMHEGGEGPPVEIAWYPDGRIKVTVSNGAPMMLRQVYLRGSTGQDAIVELIPDPQ